MTSSCHAGTLIDALVTAYNTNPYLQAQREKLRAVDETYVQSLSQFSPSVSLQLQSDYGRERFGLSTRREQQSSGLSVPGHLEQNSINGQLAIVQPIYSGGRLSADLKSADAAVRAGRAALRTAEANLLFNVIRVYADVRRDQEAVQIRALNLDMLKHQVDETEARQRAGEVTRTDVAQAQAQYASEQALFVAAQGQLRISQASYLSLVGEPSGEILNLPELIGLPDSFDAAAGFAENNNPDLEQAIFNEVASKAKVYSARAALGPTVSAQFQTGYQGSLVPYDGRDLNHVTNVTANVVFPLYSGGQRSSLVRQASDQNRADQFTVEDVHRSVVQTLAISWNQMLTAKAGVEAGDRQVQLANLAFEGMRKEYTNGDRSTLDVLVAEETLRDAELSLAAARHDHFVAQAAVLQGIGELELVNLVPKAELYRPELNLRKNLSQLPWKSPVEKIDSIPLKPIKPMKVGASN